MINTGTSIQFSNKDKDELNQPCNEDIGFINNSDPNFINSGNNSESNNNNDNNISLSMDEEDEDNNNEVVPDIRLSDFADKGAVII